MQVGDVMRGILSTYALIADSLLEDKDVGYPDTTLQLLRLSFRVAKEFIGDLNGTISTLHGAVTMPPDVVSKDECTESTVSPTVQ